jgi:hypothetical protein
MLAGYTLGRWDFACHTCDNPLCVNLEHLYVGSPQSNRDDAKARGRLNSKDGHPPFKLTVEQVLYIREECAKGIRGTQARLARELGVTPSMITMIKQRKARTTLWSEQEPA